MADTTNEVAETVAEMRPGWVQIDPDRCQLSGWGGDACAFVRDESLLIIRYVSAPCAGTLAERQALAERLTAEINAAIAPVLARHGVRS